MAIFRKILLFVYKLFLASYVGLEIGFFFFFFVLFAFIPLLALLGKGWNKFVTVKFKCFDKLPQGAYQDWKKWDICCALLLIKRHLDLRKVTKSAKATPQNIFFSKIEFSVIVNRTGFKFRLQLFWGHSKSTFAQDSRDLTPSPLFAHVRFRAPPPSPQVRLFWLELPLSPSISILVKFREKKLIMITSIFGWTQHVF